MIYYCSPYYSPHSNGVRLGYEIVFQLNNNNIPSKILCLNTMESLQFIPEKFQPCTVFLENNNKQFHISENDIVIYPEIITDNPLNAQKVVRFMLNRSGFLGGGRVNYGDADFLLAYSNLVNEHLPQLFFMVDEVDLFSELREARGKSGPTEKVSIYFGKVQKKLLLRNSRKIKNILKNYSDVHIITRRFPETRKDTLDLLNDSDLLISFDPLTNLNYEATLLDVPVLLMDDTYKLMETKFNLPLYGFMSHISKLSYAEAEVKQAFSAYSDYIAGQNDMLISAIEGIKKHFYKIDIDAQYRKETAEKNIKISRSDEMGFSSSIQEIALINIDSYLQLPFRILHMLKLLTKEVFIIKLKGRLDRELKALGLLKNS